MMKRMTVAGALAFVGVLAFRAHAAPQEPLPTVDQVIDRYVTAMGGRAALEKLTSRVTTGTIELPDMGISGTVHLTEKAPNKNYAQVEFAGMGLMREATDGTLAWEENPQDGLREKAGEELAQTQRNATFNAELHLKTMYPTMNVTGREQLGGRTVVALTATPANGTPVRMYFDAETGLLARRSETLHTSQGPTDIDAFMEDYRVVDGVKQPFLVRQITPTFSAVIRITEIKHNVAVDDAMFRKPG
jgi:hypothetical protein